MRPVNLNKWIVAVCLSIFVIFGQLLTSAYCQIKHLQSLVDLNAEARSLEMAHINELQYELYRMQSEHQYVGVKQYISGVCDAINRPDHYNNIWHAGYSQGVAVQQYADALDKKNVIYTEEKKEDAGGRTAD